MHTINRRQKRPCNSRPFLWFNYFRLVFNLNPFTACTAANDCTLGFSPHTAIGIGTSMLQFKNIVKHPIIWVPPILTSIIIAPISTCVLEISCTPVGSGMGTAGLVGILEAINVMGSSYWIPIIVIDIIAPILITWLIYRSFKKLKYIKMKILVQ